jgi:integrase
MRRSNEPRIYGPYKHGDLYRLHVVTGSGRGRTTTYRSYPTWDLANAALGGARSQAQGSTVKAAVDEMLAQMRAQGLAETTVETNEYRLWHFFQLPQNANRPLRWLVNRGEELYVAAQVKRSADTHQAELGLAKQLGEMCVKKRWLRVNPFSIVEPFGRKRHGSTKPRYRVDESRQLRAFCLARPGDQHAVITLAYLLLGSRASELVGRDKRDLDDGGRLLWIERAKTPTGNRRLIIPEELRGPLLELVRDKKPTEPIFTKENGQRATRHWAYHHVRRVMKAAGVPVLSPQALRRTVSDLGTEAGALGPVVAAHLGQTSTVVTDRSYRDRNVVADAKAERVFRVIAGGRR